MGSRRRRNEKENREIERKKRSPLVLFIRRIILVNGGIFNEEDG